MSNRLKGPSVWKIMIALLGMGVFFVLAALLGAEWGSGNGGLFFQFRYALHFLKTGFGSFLLAGAASLIGAWLGIRAFESIQKPVWLPGIFLSLFLRKIPCCTSQGRILWNGCCFAPNMTLRTIW